MIYFAPLYCEELLYIFKNNTPHVKGINRKTTQGSQPQPWSRNNRCRTDLSHLWYWVPYWYLTRISDLCSCGRRILNSNAPNHRPDGPVEEWHKNRERDEPYGQIIERKILRHDKSPIVEIQKNSPKLKEKNLGHQVLLPLLQKVPDYFRITVQKSIDLFQLQIIIFRHVLGRILIYQEHVHLNWEYHWIEIPFGPVVQNDIWEVFGEGWLLRYLFFDVT